MRIDLLSNEDGDSGPKTVQPGGWFLFSAKATWNGGALDLHLLMPDGATYAVLADTTLSADGALRVFLASGVSVKAVRSGGTPPSGIYASLMSAW